jgi:hypothetical protein
MLFRLGDFPRRWQRLKRLSELATSLKKKVGLENMTLGG